MAVSPSPDQLVTGTVPLAQYMERIFADELAAQKNADASGLVFAQQMTTSSSSPEGSGDEWVGWGWG
jgi:hypothetical protein